MTHPIRWLAATLAVAALIAGTLFALRDGSPVVDAQGGSQTDEATVTVEGSAGRAVEPDQTVIQYSVGVLNRSANQAVPQGAVVLQRIADALDDADIPEERLRTTNVSLREEFDWTEDGRVSLGFRYTNSVRVTADGADRAGGLLYTIIEAGGDQVAINSIGFDISERAQIEREVVLTALDDAKVNATAIAWHLNLTVGRVISVEVISGLSPIAQSTSGATQESALAADAARASTPTFAGVDTITARVRVVYALAR